ncbi:biotin-dependent carboxyltransferase family protein [Anoxynatronum sibiricum]|uniref:Biotin-dependent carboxyltransferase family protein n=1 Tax=Anoxynatronum sibiricum TaxID=210623 RepID=A0ABU9VZ03_9CLOT
MRELKIIKPGLLTTVQDAGRKGFQQYGVPVSGVMDHYAFEMANLLVGNDTAAAMLEATLLGPEIVFETDGLLAVTGGDLGAVFNGEPLPLWQAVPVTSGDKLVFKGIRSGCRCYIAISGGLQVPVIMGSRSTYTRGNLGGYQGRALKAGDHLPVGDLPLPAAALTQLAEKRQITPAYQYAKEITLRVVPGPQEDAFSTQGLETFYQQPYTVTNECDRMGYRLEGTPITHEAGADIISDGIAMGAVQVPGHGMPIVMMADRQTTGGYTKIANVISADLPLMAQAKPGDILRFTKVTVEEAQHIWAARQQEMATVKKTMALTPQDEAEPRRENNRYRKELFRFRRGGRPYALVVEELEE